MCHTFFENLFFASTVVEWNNVDKSIGSSESFTLFKKTILQFIQPSPHRTFNCHNPIGIKLITRLKLGLSHLQDHKFKITFLDCLNPACCCGSYYSFSNLFRGKIRSFNENILSRSNSRNSEVLSFGISYFNDTKNTSILNTPIDYIFSTKRFDVSLTNS